MGIKLAVFAAIFLFFIILPVRALASDIYFENFDNFDHATNPLWTVFLRGGSIDSVESNLLISSPPSSKMPFAYIRLEDMFTENSYVEFKFKYDNSSITYGGGLVFSEDQLEENTSPTSGDIKKKMTVGLWPSPNMIVDLFTFLCTQANLGCSNVSIIQQFDGSNSYHTVKLSRINNRYEISLDGHILLSSLPTDHTIRYLWFGNPETTGGAQNWPTIKVDYIRICSLDGIPCSWEVTPTPDPTPTPLTPVIVVPGHEATWNFPQMIAGAGNNEWEIPSFITLYDNLINSLKNVGYKEGEDLFIFGYDWRKGVSDLADDLDSYLNSLNLPQSVNFIAHSYGGLVSRAYGQEKGTEKVNKILQIGTPNMGTIEAYGAWEGATIWNRPWWQKAAVEMIVQLNSNPGELKVDTIRRLVPSIKDLLPTFDFLQNQDGSLKPESSLSQRNNSLNFLNSSPDSINPFIKILGGTNQQTESKLKIVNRNLVDEINHLWEDGKPIDNSPFVMDNAGDDTVLLSSVLGPFSDIDTIDQGHNGLIWSEDGIKKIFGELGLDETKIVSNTPFDSRERVLIAMLRSPGVLSICHEGICNEELGGVYLPDQKLFMLPDFEDNNYEISISANGETGDYKLLVGKVADEAEWRESGGALSDPAEIDMYTTASIFDETPPEIIPHLSPEPNVAGWNKTNVTLTWEIREPESQITNTVGCEEKVINKETKGKDFTCNASSNGGESTRTVTVKLDKTKPEIKINEPDKVEFYYLNEKVKANWRVYDKLSGLDGNGIGTVPSGSFINTSSLGKKEFKVSATDLAGNSRTETRYYIVYKPFKWLWRF